MPLSLPSGRLEKTTRSPPHHVAQHRPTGSKTTPPYAPRSSRFGSEPPSVDDDVDVWCYAILQLHARNDDDDLHSMPPFGGPRRNIAILFGIAKTRMVCLHDGEKSLLIRWSVSTEYWRVTDRRMDMQTSCESIVRAVKTVVYPHIMWNP